MTPEQATATSRAVDAALYEPLPEPEVTEFFGALGVLLYRGRVRRLPTDHADGVSAMNERTGWPPGMLQDDSRELSRWLSSRPGARRQATEVGEEIARQRGVQWGRPAGVTSRDMTHALQEVYDPQEPIETNPAELAAAKRETEGGAVISAVLAVVVALIVICGAVNLIAQAAPK